MISRRIESNLSERRGLRRERRGYDGAMGLHPSIRAITVASDGVVLPEEQRRGWGAAKGERRTVAVLVLLVVVEILVVEKRREEIRVQIMQQLQLKC